MNKLPQELPWEDADNKWAAMLNPILTNPLVSGRAIQNVSLTTGNNVVNHKLGRKLQGWVITGIDGVASIYDTQASNQLSARTLNLVSSADVTISLWVF